METRQRRGDADRHHACVWLLATVTRQSSIRRCNITNAGKQIQSALIYFTTSLELRTRAVHTSYTKKVLKLRLYAVPDM
jgi:hypothetical protein